MICRFIDEHRHRFGVESICRVLTEHGCRIAPRTYYAWRTRPPSKRALSDLVLTEVLARYYDRDELGRRRPESLYGSVKMWAHLNREGIQVARCTVERLMAANGWKGVTRTRRIRTTESDPDAARPADLLHRMFHAPAQNMIFVADFTYVAMHSGGFGYTALVIDTFAGTIVGWDCSMSKHTTFIERALRQAVQYRARQGHPLTGTAIHHSDYAEVLVKPRNPGLVTWRGFSCVHPRLNDPASSQPVEGLELIFGEAVRSGNVDFWVVALTAARIMSTVANT